MTDFRFYFSLGWQHLVGPGSLDHILFIVALAAGYQLRDWKKVIVMVTAFTVGHAVTLGLGSFDILRPRNNWVEIFIPVTIIVTAMLNLFLSRRSGSDLKWNYVVALVFGLVHGLAFAATLRYLLPPDEPVTLPLLAFNLGLETAQVLLVVLVLILGWVCVKLPAVRRGRWMAGLSAACIAGGCWILGQRLLEA